GLGLVFVVTALWAGPRRGVRGLALGLAGLWLIYGYWAAPEVDYGVSGQRIMATVEQRLPARMQLAMVDWRSRMILNADRPVTQFGFHTPASQQVEDAAAWLRQQPDHRRVLMTEDHDLPC